MLALVLLLACGKTAAPTEPATLDDAFRCLDAELPGRVVHADHREGRHVAVDLGERGLDATARAWVASDRATAADIETARRMSRTMFFLDRPKGVKMGERVVIEYRHGQPEDPVVMAAFAKCLGVS